MTRVSSCAKWLLLSPITGRQALICSFVAVAVPTLIRVSVDGVVSGVGFVPFIPYVFIAGPTDVFGMTVFLATSALIICFVHAFKRIVEDQFRPASDEIIFSLERGQAWASWSGTGYYLRLGHLDDVSEGMKDFLAQVDLVKQLTRDNP